MAVNRKTTLIMKWNDVLLMLCLLHFVRETLSTGDVRCELKSSGNNTKFPDHFKFGVSTAAYQIEGGWNDDGKGPSIWDTFTHNHPEMIVDRSNGDVGPDSYHNFNKDLAALKELKVHVYRFSISWARILPKGDLSLINQKGIDYYNMIIDELLENSIEPMVTMYHYDMPAELHKFGGFTNELFIDYFKFYADLLFENYGDRVKLWITFNEPFDYCIPGYGNGNYAPMVKAPGVADYLCMDITLKAHATVYRLYKTKYFEKQAGKIGISLNSHFYYSKVNDKNLVDRALQFKLGWLAHPLYTKAGNYPTVMLQTVLENSLKEGRGWSRLQPLNEDWLKRISKAADFLGINYYSSKYVEHRLSTGDKVSSWDNDVGIVYSFDETRRRAKSKWLYCLPEGLEDLLRWIRDNYENVEVIITENGWSDDGQLNDQERIDYLKAHMQAVLNAIHDGCNVTGYIAWSLLDNFEWQLGYTEKFGLYYVNMTSDHKERIAKNSAKFFRKVIEKRELNWEEES